MEQEIQTGIKSIQLVFGNSPEMNFIVDGKINYEKVKQMYTEMKRQEKERLKKAQQSAQEVQADNQMEGDESQELVKILQEESNNIKARMIQMTEQNLKL